MYSQWILESGKWILVASGQSSCFKRFIFYNWLIMLVQLLTLYATWCNGRSRDVSYDMKISLGFVKEFVYHWSCLVDARYITWRVISFAVRAFLCQVQESVEEKRLQIFVSKWFLRPQRRKIYFQSQLWYWYIKLLMYKKCSLFWIRFYVAERTPFRCLRI